MAMLTQSIQPRVISSVVLYVETFLFGSVKFNSIHFVFLVIPKFQALVRRHHIAERRGRSALFFFES